MSTSVYTQTNIPDFELCYPGIVSLASLTCKKYFSQINNNAQTWKMFISLVHTFKQLFFTICSAGFIGYASDIYSLVWDHKIEDTDDDQLYFTQLYLDQQIRVR